jgi:hypothetical protein
MNSVDKTRQKCLASDLQREQAKMNKNITPCIEINIQDSKKPLWHLALKTRALRKGSKSCGGWLRYKSVLYNCYSLLLTLYTL